MSEEKKETLEEIHMEFAKSTNNRVWDLLEIDERSRSEDEEMLMTAFTSLYHWMNAGTAVNSQRSYWMLSRVYQALDQAENALKWAQKCQEITENNIKDMKDFDLAFAREALARAYAMNGDLDRAKEYYGLAVELGNKIVDPEDKEIFVKDLQGGDWFQFTPE